jgi:hypothetical protein
MNSSGDASVFYYSRWMDNPSIVGWLIHPKDIFEIFVPDVTCNGVYRRKRGKAS